MNISPGVLYCLLPFFGWGTADFLTRKVIEKEGYYKTLFFSQVLGTLLLLGFLVVFGSPLLNIQSLLVCALLSVTWIVACLAFFKAIEVGKLAIVSPVGASWGLVGALVGIVFFLERPSLFRSLGIPLTLLGIIFVSTSLSELKKARVRTLKGVNYALFAMFGWGVVFSLARLLLPQFGPIGLVFFLKFFGVIYLIGGAPLLRENLKLPRSSLPLLFLIGLLDVIAFLGLTFGLESEFVSVVSPAAAAYPVVTVALACGFLKEKLELNHKIGIVLTVLGLVLLAVI